MSQESATAHKAALTFEDEHPEMFFYLLPKSVRDRIRPPKKKSKKATGKGKAAKPAAGKPAKKAPKAKKAAKVTKKAAAKATKPAALARVGSFTSGATGTLSFKGPSGKTVEVSGAHLSASESTAADVLFRRGSQTHKWQFQKDDHSWGDYDADASRAVELAHSSWLINPHIDVRCVKSGDWEYMVDFNMMQQQNVKHPSHKQRKIQRVPVL